MPANVRAYFSFGSVTLLYPDKSGFVYFDIAALIAPKLWILTTLFLSISDICCSCSTKGLTNSGLRLPRTRKISGASILTLSSASYRSFSNIDI